MSQACKCDRCGKLFVPPKREQREQWIGIHRDHNLFGKINLDLCTCCEKNLMEWFERGAERDGR